MLTIDQVGVLQDVSARHADTFPACYLADTMHESAMLTLRVHTDQQSQSPLS